MRATLGRVRGSPGATLAPPRNRRDAGFRAGCRQRAGAGFSSYDGDLSLPLGLALGSPIFPSGTPVFLPGESQGQRSLVGCRLWGHTESTPITTEVT